MLYSIQYVYGKDKKEKNVACKYTEWNKNRIFARNKF